MNILNDAKSYILENDLKIIIINNKIDIVNYVDIGHFDSNKVIVKSKTKDIIIKGNDLVISRLMNDEILITGDFKGLEFRCLNEK